MATSIFKEYFKGYEILGELGRGNARVLKARSLQTGELVAIKHFAFNTDPDTLRRFQRESEIMKSIEHDYVVKILEVHLDAELPYIVMQLVEGGDLRSLLKSYGTLDISTVIRLAHHMTEALDAIHAKAVVHRDVKPENIMYCRLPSGEIHFLLTDFGIAKLREQPDSITVTGSSMLTYDYASPEQFNQSRTVAAATDYYSLGIVLYECLTGSVPFEYEQDDLLMHINRVIASPVPVPRLPDGRSLPPSLLQLLEGLLTKQPSHRLSDPVSLRRLLRIAAIEELRGVQTSLVSTRQPTIVYQPLSPAPVKKGREITLAALLLLLISVAVFFSWTTLVKSNTGLPDPAANVQTTIPKAAEKKYTAPAGKKNVSVSRNSDVSTPAVADDNQTTEVVQFAELAPETQVTPVTVVTPAPHAGIALINGRYYNDFSEQQDSVWDIGKDENSEFNLQDGKYVMRGLSDSLSYSTAVKFNLDIHKDFTIAASTTHWGEGAGDPFGLNFCGDSAQDTWFVFYITSNGFYSIGAYVKDEWSVLVDWTPSANIRTAAEMNILSIEKHGGSLRFLINDKLEKVLPFTGGFGNYFGLRVDGAQTVAFDQFIVKGSQ